MLAASNGHIDLVKIFLDVNARVDVFDQEARFNFAHVRNMKNQTRFKFPHVRNMKNQNRSALHLAAESGNADICEMLLGKNAYVNRYGNDDNNYVHNYKHNDKYDDDDY